MQGYIYIYVG